jgi:hypothetical protein
VGWDGWVEVVVGPGGCVDAEDLLLAGTWPGPGLHFPLPVDSTSRSLSRSLCCWCFRAFTIDEACNTYQTYFRITKSRTGVGLELLCD